MKNFSTAHILKLHTVELLRVVLAPIGAVAGSTRVSNLLSVLNNYWERVFAFVPVAPQKKLMFQATLIAFTALITTSLSPGGSFTAASMTYSTDYINSYSLPGDILVADDSGYLIKINPQTDNSNRVGMTDYAVHTVESGETLSLIASRYGIAVSTLMWENSLASANRLRIGQKLMIPPVDGVSYKVQSGDTLEKIAKKYSISAEAIVAQNGLDSQIINQGQELFLPGAEQPFVAPTVIARAPSATRGARSYMAASSTATPAVGKIFIFPTRGSITQGYHAGHYAYDIADRSHPPIWAASAGTVVKASTGTWGGGYGNHVIIDHGNGFQTLYGHMDTVNVYEGQYLNQGDVLGIMGNTGRVYGATGIHVHWEVMRDGIKVNPGGYY